MATALAVVRACKVHRVPLQEDPQRDDMRCPHGAGHSVDEWLVIDGARPHAPIAEADRANGWKGDSRGPAAEDAPAVAAVPRNGWIRRAKLTDGSGTVLWILLQHSGSIRKPLFLVRWREHAGGRATQGVCAREATEAAAGRAYDEQLSRARSFGWRDEAPRDGWRDARRQRAAAE